MPSAKTEDLILNTKIIAIKKLGGGRGEIFTGKISVNPDPDSDCLKIQLDRGTQHPYGESKRDWMIKPSGLLSTYHVEIIN